MKTPNARLAVIILLLLVVSAIVFLSSSTPRVVTSKTIIRADHKKLLQFSQNQSYHGKAMLYANLDPYQNCQKIHLITMYFRMLSQERYQNFSAFQASNRNKEYLEVLQSNLNHPCVQRIHLFYVKEEDLEALKVANLTSMEKLHPVKQERLIQMSDFFIYASRHLLKKLVIALNGDIVLGEGVQLINVEKMLDGKLLYSLTRYEGHLKCSEKRHMCLDNYEGSHDTHIFALREPLNETVILDKLSYPINMHQAENGMIYTMRNLLKFKVTNPCLSIKTYHHHCSPFHGGGDDNYTIYNLGWTRKKISLGIAKPTAI